MNAAFVIASLLMFAAAALFVATPLWRTGATIQAEGSLASPITRPKRWASVWLATGLGLASVALYALIGNPEALLRQRPSPPAAAQASSDAGPAQIQAMVARLAQRLQTQADDPQGWRMLAKSYETLGRFNDAVQAYQNLLKHQAPTADILTDYAVTLGMSQGQTLAGEPELLIRQALQLAPQHAQALALSGSAAFEQGDYRRAVLQWNKLLAAIPPEAEMRASIERNVARAQSLIR